jgi:hypothetical protein
MYSERARALRQCQGTRKDGQPCRGWAMWHPPDPEAYFASGCLRLCGQHAGRGHRGPQLGWMKSFEERWNERRSVGDVTPCRCVAYAWPHRPGGGSCCWPDAPRYKSTIPAGTRHWTPRWRRRRSDRWRWL